MLWGVPAHGAMQGSEDWCPTRCCQGCVPAVGVPLQQDADGAGLGQALWDPQSPCSQETRPHQWDRHPTAQGFNGIPALGQSLTGQGQCWAALGAGMLPGSHLGEEAVALGFLVASQGDFLLLPCQGISCGFRGAAFQ